MGKRVTAEEAQRITEHLRLYTEPAIIGDLASTVVALDADLAALRIEGDAHAALLSSARRDRDKARAFLTSDGYRSCTSAACNCGGWHKATP